MVIAIGLRGIRRDCQERNDKCQEDPVNQAGGVHKFRRKEQVCVGKINRFPESGHCLDYPGGRSFRQSIKHLPDNEIEQLSKQISLTERVPESVQNTVIHEFMKLIEAREHLLRGGHKYAKELLEKALGPQRAEEILNKVSVSIHSTLFGWLRRVDAKQLIGLIRDEHPQTIALILTYLIPEQAALILSSLPPEKQSDIARRV
ncbi:MAG: hypothetical protein AB1523_02860, partial [Bacillota bacterium]